MADLESTASAAETTSSTPTASPVDSGPSDFGDVIDDILGPDDTDGSSDAEAEPDEFGYDDDEPAEGDAPVEAAAEAAEAQPEDDLLAPVDEEPQIDEKGKTYRYTKGYAERELLPARDFVRELRSKVDPNITVQDVQRAWGSDTAMRGITDDFLNGGDKGIERVVHDFARLAIDKLPPEHQIPAMGGFALAAARYMEKAAPDWFRSAYIEPVERRAETNLIEHFQRSSYAAAQQAKTAALNRLSGQGLVGEQLSQALAKDKEYRDAQLLLWASQKLAYDRTQQFLDEPALAAPPSNGADPLKAREDNVTRREQALNERQRTEQTQRLQAWQQEVIRSEAGAITELYNTLISGKLQNHPPGIQDAIRNQTVQEVDRLIRTDKTFMERYGQAVRNAQRTQQPQDRAAALELWKNRANAMIRAKGRELLAAANASVQSANGAAHARAKAGDARKEPSGRGAPPKRSIVPAASETKTYNSWEEQLADALR